MPALSSLPGGDDLRALWQQHGKHAKRGVPAAILLAWLLSWWRGTGKPTVLCTKTQRNERVLAMLQVYLSKAYVPCPFTLNGHLNSALAYVKRAPTFSKTRELIRTWDDGNFALDWRNRGAHEPDLPGDAPILLIIHGINGHSDEAYMLHAQDIAHKRGWRGVSLNHRGCGDTVLTSGFGYNGAFTGDIRLAVDHLRHRYPDAPIMAAGYSLGANLLVKYLGEEGAHGSAPLTAAVAVSNPWTLEQTAVNSKEQHAHHTLTQRLVGRAYSLMLVLGLRMYLHKHKHAAALYKTKDVDLEAAARATHLSHFDEAVTVPMWGYDNLQHYQKDGSSARYVKDVKVPLLCINAADDPLITPAMWPTEAIAANANVILVTTKSGGHIGWCEGLNPLSGRSWADKLIEGYLAGMLQVASASSSSSSSSGGGSVSAAHAAASKL